MIKNIKLWLQSLNCYLKKSKNVKAKYIFNGDDYQILFTAPQKKRSLIKSIAEKMNQKFTLIGKINNGHKKNSLNICLFFLWVGQYFAFHLMLVLQLKIYYFFFAFKS